MYGKEAVKRGPNEWDARSCVEGNYSWAEQQPDNDLGKSITPGFRNAIAEGRAFGVPSIRSDIQPYAQRSVADTQNYGDDSSARQVGKASSPRNQGRQLSLRYVHCSPHPPNERCKTQQRTILFVVLVGSIAVLHRFSARLLWY